MGREKPKIILTDQDSTMAKSTYLVMPKHFMNYGFGI